MLIHLLIVLLLDVASTTKTPSRVQRGPHPRRCFATPVCPCRRTRATPTPVPKKFPSKGMGHANGSDPGSRSMNLGRCRGVMSWETRWDTTSLDGCTMPLSPLILGVARPSHYAAMRGHVHASQIDRTA